MAVEVEITFIDVNGDEARTSFWSPSAANAQSAVELFGPITNCEVIKASYNTPLDITGSWNHAPATANVETARSKVKVEFEGAASGGALAFAKSTLSIPAPVGDLVNGAAGSPTDARLTPLIPLVLSAHGDAMTEIIKVRYAKSR